MNRQYIGARYVPKFFENGNSCEWVAGVSYEPMIIVTHLGNTYTSKIPVPSNIGAPNLNPKYWANTGNFNAQVEQYKEEVDMMKEEVDIMSEKLNNIDNKIISKIKGRRFIFVGDSYGVLNPSWIDHCAAQLGLVLNETYFKVTANSRGFIGDTSQSGDMSWLKLLQDNAGRITSHETITDLIVCGGINDYNHSAIDLLYATRDFCQYVNTEYPNANISIGVIGYTSNQGILQAMPKVVHCYQDATRFNATYIVGIESSWHYNGWLIDDRHPNSDATYIISANVTNHVLGKNGIPSYTDYKTTDLSASGICASGTTQYPSDHSCITAQMGDMIDVTLQLKVTFRTPVSITCSDNWQELATLGEGYIIGTAYGNGVHGTIHIYSASENIYHVVPCDLRIEGKKLKARFPWKGASGTADKVIQCSELKIPSFHLLCPTVGN